MEQKIPRTVSRDLTFENGKAIGISNRWNKGQYCSILTAAGIVGCGIYDISIAAEFDMAFAVAKGTPENPLVESITHPDQHAEVQAYRALAEQMSSIERQGGGSASGGDDEQNDRDEYIAHRLKSNHGDCSWLRVHSIR